MHSMGELQKKGFKMQGWKMNRGVIVTNVRHIVWDTFTLFLLLHL